MVSSNARAAGFGLLALALVAGAVALAALRAPEEAGAARVRVLVEGPSSVIWNGTLDAENGTALSVLLAAADAGGFAVEKRTYPYGSYVVAIDGHRARGTAGWVYAVERDGERREGDRAADRTSVQDGDLVAWWWTERPLA